jgi:stress response protein YsnF
VITLSDLARLHGQAARDSSGEVVGRIEQIYLSDSSNEPEWVTLAADAGDAGDAGEAFVPVQGAEIEGDELRLPWTRGQVVASPRVPVDAHLSPADEAQLVRHYGVDLTSTRDRSTEEPEREAGGETVTTLSGERVNVETEEVIRRLRLRRYTTTEMHTVEVPLKRERLAIERVVEEGSTPEVLQEFTIREERVVSVQTEAFAVEDVQVAKDAVTEETRLAVEVARERIDLETEEGFEPEVEERNH